MAPVVSHIYCRWYFDDDDDDDDDDIITIILHGDTDSSRGGHGTWQRMTPKPAWM